MKAIKTILVGISGGLLMAAGALAAEQVRTGRLPNGLPVSHFRLANGLELYVVENRAAPIFTYQTWFNVGAKDEKLDPRLNATGLAHLFEHMMFRGTATHADGEFDAILTRNGVADANATTWNDRTNYYQSLPKDKLELVMELESDRMHNLVIEQGILDTERGAVLGEYNMGLDDPDTVAYEKLYATAFTVHPYKYTTIGTEEEIRRFSKADADYFYRKYYAPNNAVILIAGDIEPRAAVQLAEKYYGPYLPQAITPVAAPAEPEQKIERQVEFRHGQLNEATLLLGYHTPNTRHADHAALLVLQSILTSGEGSVLQQAWVNAGLAVTLTGGLDQFEDPGLLTIGADLQDGHEPAELLGVLDRRLTELAASPALARETERARNQLLLRIYGSWRGNSTLSSYMGEFIASAGDPLYAFELAAAVEKVTAEDVQRAIARYLIPGNRTVVVGRPAEEKR
jgi:zinc protease